MVFHIERKISVDPVKWSAPKSRCVIATGASSLPMPGKKLITPGGSPASSNSNIVCQAASICVSAGFHRTVLPMSAGAIGRLPAIAVKLNGVSAKVNPSSGRSSIMFHMPGDDDGCSAYSRAA
jgi:hypothetical protein